MACARELVTAPFEIYRAPVGTDFPLVTDEPGAFDAAWELVGSLGARRYTEDGVELEWTYDLSDVDSVGALDPECVLLTGREFMIRVTMMDLSLDQLRNALNLNVVSDAGGIRSIDLDPGTELETMALLVRGQNKSGEPDADTGDHMQWEFSNAIEVGDKSVTFTKEEVASVSLEWRALAGTKTLRSAYTTT